MRHVLSALFLYLTSYLSQAQTGQDIIAELVSINKSVTEKSCHTDSAAAISHRAMNVFLADKTGYLATGRNLSFYTNYASLNTSEGKFTVNHNFQPAAGTDDPIKSLFSFGFDITVANSNARDFLDKRFENEIGITLNYTWLGKVKTRFADGDAPKNMSSQQQAMDALRASLTAQLQNEIIKKEKDFNLALETIDSSAVTGQDMAAAKMVMQKNFYADLKAAYEEKFAVAQAALLSKTVNFKFVHTSWTSITAYIPLFFPKYTLASSFTSPFTSRQPWPVSLEIGHTNMWEMRTTGRLFFTLNAAVLFNNAKLSYGLAKMNDSEYKSLGGTESLQTTDPGNDKLYIGRYASFVTPSLTARLVYFPTGSHVGISFLTEKAFGDYNLLNCRLGVPVVLINSKKTPAVNVECYVLFFDLTNQNKAIGKTAAGLAIGVPFSRLMY